MCVLYVKNHLLTLHNCEFSEKVYWRGLSENIPNFFLDFRIKSNNSTMFNQTVKLMGRQLMKNSVRFGSHGGVPGEVIFFFDDSKFSYVILTLKSSFVKLNDSLGCNILSIKSDCF